MNKENCQVCGEKRNCIEINGKIICSACQKKFFQNVSGLFENFIEREKQRIVEEKKDKIDAIAFPEKIFCGKGKIPGFMRIDFATEKIGARRELFQGRSIVSFIVTNRKAGKDFCRGKVFCRVPDMHSILYNTFEEMFVKFGLDLIVETEKERKTCSWKKRGVFVIPRYEIYNSEFLDNCIMAFLKDKFNSCNKNVKAMVYFINRVTEKFNTTFKTIYPEK